MKNFKLSLLSAVAALGFVTAAQAQVITGEDNNIDFLLNSNLTPKTSGTIAVGDVLVSVFELDALTVGGVSQIPAGSEVTGLAVIQVTGMIGAGGVGTIYTFAPYSGGFNAVSPVDVTNGGALEGAMIAMFLNSATGDDNLQIQFGTTVGTPGSCESLAECLAEATSGTLLQVDGFNGDLDQFWFSVITAPGGADPSQVAGTNGALGVAQFNAALGTFYNIIGGGPIGFMDIVSGAPCPAGSLAADGCIQGPTVTGPILGGAGLNAGILADGAFARSDLDAQKLLAQVPEPGTLALLGLGLLGLAGGIRRRVC